MSARSQFPWPSSAAVLVGAGNALVVSVAAAADNVRKHGLEIAQLALDAKGPAPMYDVASKKNSSEMHK